MNNLDILIAELQKEYDYLKGEMDRCVEDWDFVGAEKFKHPLVYILEERLIHLNQSRILIIKESSNLKEL